MHFEFVLRGVEKDGFDLSSPERLMIKALFDDVVWPSDQEVDMGEPVIIGSMTGPQPTPDNANDCVRFLTACLRIRDYCLHLKHTRSEFKDLSFRSGPFEDGAEFAVELTGGHWPEPGFSHSITITDRRGEVSGVVVNWDLSAETYSLAEQTETDFRWIDGATAPGLMRFVKQERHEQRLDDVFFALGHSLALALKKFKEQDPENLDYQVLAQKDGVLELSVEYAGKRAVIEAYRTQTNATPFTVNLSSGREEVFIVFWVNHIGDKDYYSVQSIIGDAPDINKPTDIRPEQLGEFVWAIFASFMFDFSIESMMEEIEL